MVFFDKIYKVGIDAIMELERRVMEELIDKINKELETGDTFIADSLAMEMKLWKENDKVIKLTLKSKYKVL